MLLQDYFEQSRKRWPDKTAVTCLTDSRSYEELGQMADSIATALFGHRSGRVGFWMRRRIPAIAAILGILKSGNCYVPLDPDSPPSRVAKIIGDCDLSAILVDNEMAAGIAGLDTEHSINGPILSVDDNGHCLCLSAKDSTQVSRVAPPVDESGDGLAYIFYTSGSTGRPKGVMISQTNVTSFVEWARQQFRIASTDQLANPTPLFFDLSTFDLHVTFSAGATLNLITEKELLSPKAIADWIERRGISVWFSVPSVLSYLCRTGVLRDNIFRSLRAVLWCGEPFAARDLAQWMRLLPGKTYANLYGPTEATVACTFQVFQNAPTDLARPITVGVPRTGCEALILGENDEVLPPGEIGELCVGGNCVMRGYWRDQERTRRALISDPRQSASPNSFYRTGDLAALEKDGTLSLHGRKDNQVKSRGYRIELGEIEAALLSHPQIAVACVVAHESVEFGNVKIKGYYESQDRTEASEAMNYLSKLLPKYMLPQKLEWIQTIPRLPNGKVDRQACKKLGF